MHSFPDPHLALSIKSDYGLAYRTTVGAKETTHVNGIFDMAAARNMKEARAALDKVTGIYLNVVYATKRTSGWIATGKYPARKGASGLFPRIGWNWRRRRDGYFAPSENPSVLNPKEGYFATANHRVWDDSTELWVSFLRYGGDRADRAKELLAQGTQHTAADMAKFQGDVFSHTAKRVKEIGRSRPGSVPNSHKP